MELFTRRMDVLRLLLVCILFRVAVGGGHMKLTLLRYDNPKGRVTDGSCCGGGYHADCPDNLCNPQFILCLDKSWGVSSINSCRYGSHTTGITSGRDVVVFGDNIGGTPNPISFDFETWPRRALLKVAVVEKGRAPKETDFFMLRFMQGVAATPVRYTLRERTRLLIEIQVGCGENWFGSFCTDFCQPKDNADGHFGCHPHTGQVVCLPGWSGPSCSDNVDECASNPCYPGGGTCVDGRDSFTCDCLPGFRGRLCEPETCDSDPCQNGASCVAKLYQYECDCLTGYTGVNCETEVDECESSPCQNGGTCHNYVGMYTCACPPGFMGGTCSVDTDECRSAPCQNGATCENGAGQYICRCPVGFDGVNCEQEVTECDSSPCLNGATCQELTAEGYTCTCGAGYTGSHCETDIDDCATRPCHNGGDCVDEVDGYRCDCMEGYQGARCEQEVLECASSPCVNGGTCNEGIGGYVCVCGTGYVGTNCEQDVDECSSAPCDNGATCEDGPAGFTCICAEGFEGETCESEVDECESSPCQHGGWCTDDVAGYRCTCMEGYRGDDCEEDVDECSSEPCQNGATCVDQISEFICECAPGFTGESCEQNTDECASSPCFHGGRCEDEVAGYRCACRDGFSGARCEFNINECESSPCLFDGLCVDGENGFTCLCVPGYEGSSCEKNVDDCASDPCENGAVCNDEVNAYNCTCAAGYEGVHCGSETNECSSNPCQNGATCNDQLNSYSCNCSTGFEGPLCEENIDECASDPCQNQATCVDGIDGYVCRCTHGFTGRHCGLDVVDCLPGICQHGGTCTEGRNDYICTCATGFEGDQCEVNINECTSNPCENKGNCVDGVNGYECLCHLGFIGTHCETNNDECESDPCQNGAACQDEVNGYSCECAPGYEGKNCEVDTDECASGPCENGGTCSDEVDGYICYCAWGYEDADCGTEKNECYGEPCRNGGICIDLIGGYECECMDGYEGDHCEENTDDCASDPCVFGKCHDKVDGYECKCDEGFEGSNCETNTDECLSVVCLNGGTCEDAVDHFRCACRAGFSGRLCEENVDECESGPCMHGGTCTDGVDSYTCTCLDGVLGTHCEQLTACSGTPCGNNGNCVVDAEGDFGCVCDPGFSGVLCDEEILYCPMQLCQNNGTCVPNLPHGYQCLCAEGWTGYDCSEDMRGERSHTLQVQLVRYVNPGGKLDDGRCCDGQVADPCPTQSCDHSFSLCADHYQGSENDNECPGGKMITGIVPDDEDIVFGDEIGTPNGTDNPVSFTFREPYTGGAMLKVKVKDAGNETSEDEDVDFLISRFRVPMEAGPGDSPSHGVIAQGRTRLELRLRVFCNENYFGAECAVHCKPQDKATGHYVCDEHGNKVCLQDWEGVNCDINKNSCTENSCQNEGTCVDEVNGYHCECRPNYIGKHCELEEPVDYCTPNPCMNGGTCAAVDGGYSCECPRGRTGSSCSVLKYELEAPSDRLAITLRLVAYTNPDGKEANGTCCDTPARTDNCPVDCDHYFVVCLQPVTPPDSEPLEEECIGGEKKTGAIWNRNTLQFSDNIGGTANPLFFPYNDSSLMEFVVNVTVWDIDTHKEHDLVEELRSLVHVGDANTSSDDRRTSFNVTLSGKTKMSLVLEKQCNEHWYGDDCDALCVPRDSDRYGHYSCDDVTGAKQCHDGYEGVYCRQKADPCSGAPCGNGTCNSLPDGDFNCTCDPGYQGDLCEELQPITEAPLRTTPLRTTVSPLTWDELVQLVTVLREEMDDLQEDVADIAKAEPKPKFFTVDNSGFKDDLDEYLRTRFVCSPFLSEDDPELEEKVQELLKTHDWPEDGEEAEKTVLYSLRQFRNWRADVKQKLTGREPEDPESLSLEDLGDYLLQDKTPQNMSAADGEKREQHTILLRAFTHENELFGSDTSERPKVCQDWEFWDYFRHYYVRAQRDMRNDKWKIFGRREETRIDAYLAKPTKTVDNN